MSTPPSRVHERIPLHLYRLSSPGIARVLSNKRLTPSECDDVRHIVLDLSGLDYHYLEGQSLGILTPGVDQRGHAHKLRLYSIASTRVGDDGRGTTASLCVKRVVYSDPVTFEEHRGVASNYLCDLEPGDEVAITGPDGTHFLLPDDPATNLILVATGTGIAPFRAFLRRIYRERDDWTGAVYLFFGVRTEAECLYRDEFDSYLDRPGYHRIYTFSREQKTADGRRHVRPAPDGRADRRAPGLAGAGPNPPLHLRAEGDGGWDRGHLRGRGPIRRRVIDIVPRPACGGTNPGRDLLKRPIPFRRSVAP